MNRTTFEIRNYDNGITAVMQFRTREPIFDVGGKFARMSDWTPWREVPTVFSEEKKLPNSTQTFDEKLLEESGGDVTLGD